MFSECFAIMNLYGGEILPGKDGLKQFFVLGFGPGQRVAWTLSAGTPMQSD